MKKGDRYVSLDSEDDDKTFHLKGAISDREYETKFGKTEGGKVLRNLARKRRK